MGFYLRVCVHVCAWDCVPFGVEKKCCLLESKWKIKYDVLLWGLSVCMCVCPLAYLPVCLAACLYVHDMCVFVCLAVCLSGCMLLFLFLSVCVSMCVYIYIYICICIYICIYIYINIHVYIYICVYTYPHFIFIIYISIYVYLYMFIDTCINI